MATDTTPTGLTWRVERGADRHTIETLRGQLAAYNVAQARVDAGLDLGIFIYDAQGQLVGGIAGWVWGQVLEVSFLWLHPDLRGLGYGKRLLETLEEEARAQGCRLAILDTFSFQAPAFYQRLGYEAFGSVDGYPEGHRKVFFRKDL
jgi:GNAT superfamily N-acetyltransferase